MCSLLYLVLLFRLKVVLSAVIGFIVVFCEKKFVLSAVTLFITKQTSSRGIYS
jgi:hypothetical protein